MRGSCASPPGHSGLMPGSDDASATKARDRVFASCRQAINSHLDGRREGVYNSPMAEPQLSVRSARARDLAHRLARRERRTVAEVVERALEAYEATQTGREPAADFYTRLAKDCSADIDLEAELRTHRRVHSGPDL